MTRRPADPKRALAREMLAEVREIQRIFQRALRAQRRKRKA